MVVKEKMITMDVKENYEDGSTKIYYVSVLFGRQ